MKNKSLFEKKENIFLVSIDRDNLKKTLNDEIDEKLTKYYKFVSTDVLIKDLKKLSETLKDELKQTVVTNCKDYVDFLFSICALNENFEKVILDLRDIKFLHTGQKQRMIVMENDLVKILNERKSLIMIKSMCKLQLHLNNMFIDFEKSLTLCLNPSSSFLQKNDNLLMNDFNLISGFFLTILKTFNYYNDFFSKNIFTKEIYMNDFYHKNLIPQLNVLKKKFLVLLNQKFTSFISCLKKDMESYFIIDFLIIYNFISCKSDALKIIKECSKKKKLLL